MAGALWSDTCTNKKLIVACAKVGEEMSENFLAENFLIVHPRKADSFAMKDKHKPLCDIETRVDGLHNGCCLQSFENWIKKKRFTRVNAKVMRIKAFSGGKLRITFFRHESLWHDSFRSQLLEFLFPGWGFGFRFHAVKGARKIDDPHHNRSDFWIDVQEAFQVDLLTLDTSWMRSDCWRHFYKFIRQIVGSTLSLLYELFIGSN